MKKKIFFITNMCAHYSVRLYELLSQKEDVEYFFTGGEESYWEKKNKKWDGDFKSTYLKGVFILPKFRITLGLFGVLLKKYDILIKTIDDRFALPVTFLFAKLFRRPFIFWVGLWQHPQTRFHRLSYVFTKIIYRYSDAIVVYGEHITRYLVSIGIEQEKIFCAPHAVDNSFFNKEVSAQDRDEIKVGLGISSQKILLYVGRLEMCKGLEYFIEAVSGIYDSEAVVIFIGDGSQKDILEEKCCQLNVRSRFIGFVPNDHLHKYYAVADIFVLPSISTKDFKEPWGLVVNEAMNQGCPVVTTDAVGAAAGGLVEHGYNGYVVPERDSGALRDVFKKLLCDDRLRGSMALNAHKKISTWTSERAVEGFVRAIEYVRVCREGD